ncbi:MAG: cell division protein FtsZ, partial [Rhodospirillales bacterium]|nr:cell division protein FtsZ [Rhodospirillales bacterium]
FEVDQAANRIREEVDEEANVIFGSAVDESLTGRIRVSVVATGIDSPKAEAARPKLVAVGGGAMPAPAPIPVPGGMPAAMTVPAATPSVSAMPLRQASPALAPAPAPIPQAAPAEAVAVQGAEPMSMATQPAGQPMSSAHVMPLRQPAAQPMAPAARGGLFAEAPRPTATPANPVAAPAPSMEPVRPSLFSQVTGAFRRRPMMAPGGEMQPQPQRQEPVATPVRAEAPQATSRAVGGDEVGLDIPAFLRRQTS